MGDMGSREDAVAGILGPTFGVVSTDGATALKALDLPADAEVLDVGTGKGLFAIYLALQGYRVLTGEPSTDTSHYAGQDWAQKAEKVGVRDNIRFQAFDAGDMPFESESFDAVFFFGVLHHIAEPVRSHVMREALRVAKASGAVVFLEPGNHMLEKVRVDDPEHPDAADPSNYLTNQNVREHRIDGALMDIRIYEKTPS